MSDQRPVRVPRPKLTASERQLRISRGTPLQVIVVPPEEPRRKPWLIRSAAAVGRVLSQPWMQNLIGLLTLLVAVVAVLVARS